jgi:hypothetical protein
MKNMPPEFTLRDMHKLAPVQQVGALQMAGATNTLSELDLKLYKAVKLFEDPNTSEALKRKLEFQITQLSSALNHMKSVDSGALQRLAPHVQRADLASPRFIPFGDRTARKMGMTFEALADAPSAGSFSDLEFCGGGRVP